MRSKVYRSKCSLLDPKFITMHVASTWAGLPITRAWRRLEWLDENQGTLLDLCKPSTNPFQQLQCELTKMLTELPEQSSLQSLWHHLRVEPTELLASKELCFRILASTSSQSNWRFSVVYDEDPFALLSALFVGTEGRKTAVARFWARPECCLESRMARKLKKAWASEEEMHEDVAFWSAFRLWGR